MEAADLMAVTPATAEVPHTVCECVCVWLRVYSCRGCCLFFWGVLGRVVLLLFNSKVLDFFFLFPDVKMFVVYVGLNVGLQQ